MKRFDDDSIQIDLLKKYAYQRWAALPRNIIPLTAADPDFQVAPEIREAIIQLGKDGIFSYGEIGGNKDFSARVSFNGVFIIRAVSSLLSLILSQFFINTGKKKAPLKIHA